MPDIEIEGEPPLHYDARISLRIWAPTIEPQEMTAVLGLRPDATYRKGDTQRLAHGRVWPARPEPESFWVAGLVSITSPPDDLPRELERQLDYLEQARPFFDLLRAEGGRAHFLVGYFMRKSNTGDTFGAPLLARLAEFGIGLDFDIYDPATSAGFTSAAPPFI
jgi:hypothetical protein